jgi:hypothetical protein
MRTCVPFCSRQSASCQAPAERALVFSRRRHLHQDLPGRRTNIRAARPLPAPRSCASMGRSCEGQRLHFQLPKRPTTVRRGQSVTHLPICPCALSQRARCKGSRCSWHAPLASSASAALQPSLRPCEPLAVCCAQAPRRAHVEHGARCPGAPGATRGGESMIGLS